MKNGQPTHAVQRYFPVDNGCLVVGGIPLPRLVHRVGRTPFYAYDRSLITSRVTELRQHLPEGLRIHYAIKANPMPALVQHMATLVDGFDLASLGEMRIALDTTMPADHISIAGPGKSGQELRSAVAAGITVNVESPVELARLADIGMELGYRPKVAIRVNPDFELRTSGMKMGGGPKPFGIDAEQVPGLLADFRTLDLEFRGFHIFSGSQNLRVEAIIEAQQKTFELALRLSGHAPAPIRSLNIGGGFGIPYFPGDQPLDLMPIGENLSLLVPQIRERLGDVEVIVELGRYLVGEAGIYVCRVIDRKISRGNVFLVTDGGLHHHLAASGNFGQVIRKNYPVTIGNRMESQTTEQASIVGPLCTPLDLLADKMTLPAADIGDLVVVFQSGAYGPSASPAAFLSHPPPVELLV